MGNIVWQNDEDCRPSYFYSGFYWSQTIFKSRIFCHWSFWNIHVKAAIAFISRALIGCREPVSRWSDSGFRFFSRLVVRQKSVSGILLDTLFAFIRHCCCYVLCCYNSFASTKIDTWNYLVQLAVQVFPSLITNIVSLDFVIVMAPFMPVPMLTSVLASFFENSTLLRSGIFLLKWKEYVAPILVTIISPSLALIFSAGLRVTYEMDPL